MEWLVRATACCDENDCRISCLQHTSISFGRAMYGVYANSVQPLMLLCSKCYSFEAEELTNTSLFPLTASRYRCAGPPDTTITTSYIGMSLVCLCTYLLRHPKHWSAHSQVSMLR